MCRYANGKHMGCDPNDVGSIPTLHPVLRSNMQNAAFEEGYKAFQQGKSSTTNPYTADFCFFIFAREWDKGWEQGWRESDLFS